MLYNLVSQNSKHRRKLPCSGKFFGVFDWSESCTYFFKHIL